MIKKIIIILFIIPVFLFPQNVYANHKPGVEYHLPYPGILPDNPVYIVKTIRDIIEEFLISDPLESAGYNLSIADVRMSAALTLAEQKNNISLSLDTVSGAVNYFQDAVGKTNDAKNQGIETDETVNKLNQASLKYLEIINKINLKTESKDKEKAGSLAKKFENAIKEINP